MKYAFIQANRQRWSIVFLCEQLSVSRQGYYDWLVPEPSARTKANAALDEKIQTVFDDHKGRYGTPRVTEELKAQGEPVGLNRVARRMKNLKLKAKQAKKFKAATNSPHGKRVYPNRLKQDFDAARDNQKWVTDITALWTRAGWLYLCVFIDCYHRKVIGWAMSKRMTQAPVCDAPLMTLWYQGFPEKVIIHSERGSQ